MVNNNHNLQNKHVLITRPAHQANVLCRLIQQQGGQVVLLPTITIEFIDNNPAVINLIKALSSQEMAIFISPNAVQATHLLMQKYAVTWPKHVAIAAVGASTAQALAALNLNVTIMPEQFNSEALLVMPMLQQVHNKQIIIFQGEGGRGLLSAVLRERGALVSEAVVYRRLLPVIDVQNLLPAWQAGGLDIIVATSNTGLQNLLTIIGAAARNWLLNMPLLVISERMAQFAKDLDFVKKPIVSDNATDEAIVQALLNYYHR